MDKYKLHETAELLADTHSAYVLARLLVECTELLDHSDRYSDTDMHYRSSPFCTQVREWLSDNLKTITPDGEFSDFVDTQGGVGAPSTNIYQECTTVYKDHLIALTKDGKRFDIIDLEDGSLVDGGFSSIKEAKEYIGEYLF